LFLIPLLRLADAFDQSKEQRVDEISCQIAEGAVHVLLRGAKIDLELWAAERVGEVFAGVYGRTLAVGRGRK
jgi:hypothetical protein